MMPLKSLLVSTLVKEGLGAYSGRTVRRWIKNGTLKTEVVDNQEYVSFKDNSTLLRAMLFREPRRRLNVYAPEDLPAYSTWHDAFDCLVWLLCVQYTTPDAARTRRFRLDHLLAAYLKAGESNRKRIKLCYEPHTKRSTKRARQDLLRGWYHELAYSLPLRHTTLEISSGAITDGLDASASRFAFPTWRIVSNYYSAYFMIRSATALKTSEFRQQEHRSSLNAFKANLASPLRPVLWRYPLGIEVRRSHNGFVTDGIEKQQDHLKFAYCRHPRDPHRTPAELQDKLTQLYLRQAKLTGSHSYGLMDLLRDFRVWANYQDIDNLVKLRSRAYKAYLDRNLAIILFFVCSLAELSYISVVGPGRFLNRLQQLYDFVTRDNEIIARTFPS